MNTIKQRLFVIMTVIFCFSFTDSRAQGSITDISQTKSDFQWPEGKKMGLSLTFDDARLTQIDNGIPLLDKYAVKATFYVSPDDMIQRLEGWKAAIKNGHDIGNHSLIHPCTIN